VLLFNDGRFADAVRVLNRGLHKDKTAAHLHYVKAVAKVLAGQRTGALIPLKKAIALEPDIRILALGDPDLQSVINRAPFSKVVAGPDQ
jgi:Flp pilus assembly protein TadD